MLNISFAHGLRLPAELTLLAKALFNLDAVTRSLDPTFSPIETIREFSTRIANERAKREMSLSRVFQVATQTSDLISALPHRLDIVTQKLAANELGLKVEVPQVHALLRGLQKIANRVFSGLVLGAVVVASAMLLPHRRTLGTTGFIIAALIGLYMVVSILVQDRSETNGERAAHLGLMSLAIIRLPQPSPTSVCTDPSITVSPIRTIVPPRMVSSTVKCGTTDLPRTFDRRSDTVFSSLLSGSRDTVTCAWMRPSSASTSV